MAGSPDTVEELPPGVGATGMRGEHREELELLGPKPDDLAWAPDLMGDEVDLGLVGDAQDRLVATTGAFLEDRQARDELHRVDGVGKSFVRTGAQGVESIVDGAGRADDDDPQ